MEFVPAATLWILTVIRLPAALDPHRGSVFRATILAAVACILYVPSVYHGVDPLLGGQDRVGLVILVSLLLGFWQFRTAIILAAIPDVEVRLHPGPVPEDDEGQARKRHREALQDRFVGHARPCSQARRT